MQLQGKLVLVTGSSRGIGKQTAIAFAKAGADVIVHYLNNKTDAQDVANIIEGHGRRCFVVQGDVCKEQDIRRMRDEIHQQSMRTVDVLVNNAGAILFGGNWLEAPVDVTEKTIATNLTATILCSQIFSPDLIAKKSGSIINLTSTYGMSGAAPVLAYTAAKAGVINITHSLARELGHYGITVNAIAPGNIDTDMTKRAGDEFIAEVCKSTPLGRLGKPEEVAEAIVRLVENDFITGHVLVVDGGHILNM